MQFADALPSFERIVTALGVFGALINSFIVSRRVKDTQKTFVEIKMEMDGRMTELLEHVRQKASAEGELSGRKAERLETATAAALVVEAKKAP